MTDLQSVTSLVNGTVLGMDPAMTVSEAVLIEEGRIAFVGDSESVKRLCRERGGQVIDLEKKTILPGFHDCHMHMMLTGLNASGIELYNCASVGEVLDIVREEARRVGPDKWVFCNRLDESRLAEKRPPTLAELDKAAPGNPVYVIDRGGHYTLVNSAAFRQMKLSPSIPGVRLGAGGEVNGRLHEEAAGISQSAFFDLLDESDIEKMMLTTANRAASKGVTTLDAIEGGKILSNVYVPTFRKLMGRMPVDVVLWWTDDDINKILEAGLPRQGKDILLDGSIGSRTAAFSEPYSDAPDTKGLLYYPDDKVEAMIEAAHVNNIQIAFHAIGELAIIQALNAFEKVFRRHPGGDHRHSIEHWGFAPHWAVEKTAELGLVISTQPSFMFLRGGPDTVYRSRLGEARERRGYPLREFLDAGIVVTGGSDSDVTPIDPLLGIHAAVNQPYPESSVTVVEALKMFTSDGAWGNREEAIKGSLEEGKQADLVILSDSPLVVPATGLKDISVLATMKKGVVTYQQ